MPTPAYSITFSAIISATADSGGAGTPLIPSSAGESFVVATSANRGSRRTTGVALGPFTAGGAIEIQQMGLVDYDTFNMGVGSASWVRVSSAGALERCTPSGSDDVVGYCDADGALTLMCGILTATIATGGTSVTGTGFVHATSGAIDAAAAKVNLTAAADVTVPASGVVHSNGSVLSSSNVVLTSEVTGTLPVANGGTGLTVVGSSGNVLTSNGSAWVSSAPTGEANTASNLGTGKNVYKTKSGVDLQFRSLVAGTNITLTENTNDITIDASGGGGTPGGSNTQVQFNDSAAFGGDAGLTYNKTTDVLTVGVDSLSSGAVAISGGGPLATTGNIRFCNNQGEITMRNNANSANLYIISANNNSIEIGDSNIQNITYNVKTGNTHSFQVNGSSIVTIDGSTLTRGNTILGSGYVSAAASPAATGVIRLGDSGDLSQIVWKDGGGTDRALVSTSTTGNGTTFGYTAGPTNMYGTTCTIYSASSTTYLYGAAVQQMTLDGTNINHLTPMAGSTTAGMRLTQSALSFTVLTDYTLSGSEIAAPYQKYSDSGGGPGSGTKNIIGPTQTGAIYFVDNRMSATYVLFKTSGGTGPTIQNGYRAWVICDGTDYKLMAAATNA